MAGGGGRGTRSRPFQAFCNIHWSASCLQELIYSSESTWFLPVGYVICMVWGRTGEIKSLKRLKAAWRLPCLGSWNRGIFSSIKLVGIWLQASTVLNQPARKAHSDAFGCGRVLSSCPGAPGVTFPFSFAPHFVSLFSSQPGWDRL